MATPTRDLESQLSHDHKRPLLDSTATGNKASSTSNSKTNNTNKASSSTNSSSSNNNNNNTNNFSSGSGGGNAISNAEAAFAKAFKSTADLAKHLPTGSVLIFQILSPVFTNQGECDDVNRDMAKWLIIICCLTVFFLNFTDSFIDSGNNVRYVVATFNGLWVIDGSTPPDPEVAKMYSIKFIDFLHAVMAVMVFASVALFDNNIESCFYPVMSYDTRQILTVVPLATGLIGSALFVVFPSTRRGIGFPSLSN
ncbi:hypothetical protein LUZ62_066084 [Rhynchospora pubera]|uniref:Uncharacterized protein n=1 Tax=Rhynchospora pubera TaxID=906938 RepID=A0AAV8ESR2_9POAL|nr:hypothetical protein LUZ62_066084 [Rhynchospora pubera]